MSGVTDEERRMARRFSPAHCSVSPPGSSPSWLLACVGWRCGRHRERGDHDVPRTYVRKGYQARPLAARCGVEEERRAEGKRVQARPTRGTAACGTPLGHRDSDSGRRTELFRNLSHATFLSRRVPCRQFVSSLCPLLVAYAFPLPVFCPRSLPSSPLLLAHSLQLLRSRRLALFLR